MTDYRLADPSQVPSPALLFYRDRIRHNITRMLARAGSADRLRPHCKTHKTRQIVRMLLETGVTKHKCATIAEAEMLAQEKVPDILIAYPLVGPNVDRFVRLMKTYPDSKFRTLVDSAAGAEGLSRGLAAANLTAEIVLDLDVGQHRTGIAPGTAAVELYAKIATLPGLKSGGLQAYDGHVHQGPLSEREASVSSEWRETLATRDELRRRGHVVPRIVVGGTPSMPGWEHVAEAEIELSPGTCVLSDHGYGSRYADLSDFVVAAALLTRVVSKPTANRVTLDLGTKSVASDPPAGKRTRLLEIPDAEQVAHNEEHLVIETPSAPEWAIGDVTYAWPTHICPTCALHQEALVVEDGKIVDRWPIASRDRRLTI
jgi:D-serine deaminase-like pyridoxal phosphate-dependent protein